MFFGKNNQYFQWYKEEYKVFQKKFVSSLFIIFAAVQENMSDFWDSKTS